MLKERGIDLGREPNDIDIIVSHTYPDDIIVPPFCNNKEMEWKDGYEVLKRCYFYGLKIEFITDLRSLKESTYINGNSDCKFATVDSLLRAKMDYLRHDSNKTYLDKTRRDIDVILTHIKNVVNK